MAVILPYLKIIQKFDAFSPSRLDEVLRRCLLASKDRPCYLELSDGKDQRYLFFREKQIYAAGRIRDLLFSDSPIKEFLMSIEQMNFPRVTCYEVNSKVLHSMLIIFQKKPSIKISTSLVDLDELLDRIEEEGKSCIVSAAQDEFLAILRYEKGKVTALCHELSLPYPKEANFREDFLVKIYTLSAEKPLVISLYEDLLVRYANDAKMIDDSYKGRIVDLYLSKPPVITLEFKEKEIEHWLLDKPELKIGRTPDNDIIIDNLAVSRLHAIIQEDKGHYFIIDCDSLNGTIVNGKRIGRAKLEDGDEIKIGKHKILFRKQEGKAVHGVAGEGYDKTVIISQGRNTTDRAASTNDCAVPRLIQRTPDGEKVIELNKGNLILGKDAEADIEIDGFLVAKRHAEIVREGSRYVIKHLKGLRKVKVCGRAVHEYVLKNHDEIKIADKEFIFLE